VAPRITNVGSSMMTRLRIVPLALGLALGSQLGFIPLILVLVSASLIPLGVGVPALIGSIAMCRWFADLHRDVAGSLLGREVPRPYRPIRSEERWIARFRIAGGDPATWRDLSWLLANTVVGLVINLLVVVLPLTGLFYVTMPLWWGWLPAGSDIGSMGAFRVHAQADTLWMALFGVGLWIFWLWVTPRLMWLNAIVTANLLGPTYVLHPHRYCHRNEPGSTAQRLHKDTRDFSGDHHLRHHRPRWLIAFYYPQDVSSEMGPRRSCHARSASPENAFARLSIGTRCWTTANCSDGPAPTRCVGESGDASSG